MTNVQGATQRPGRERLHWKGYVINELFNLLSTTLKKEGAFKLKDSLIVYPPERDRSTEIHTCMSYMVVPFSKNQIKILL